MREKKQFQLAATVTAKVKRGDVCSIQLRSPEVSRYAQAGQFVMVRVNDEHTSDPLLRRPFSIHRVESETIFVLFKVVGRGTEMLAATEVGDTVNVVGPLGNGFTVKKNTVHYLVGGGMGIAPLLFLAEQIKGDDDTAQVVALIGSRNKQELIAVDDLQAVTGGVEVRIATDDGSCGHHGLVTDLLATVVDGTVYCCGPWPMMRAVAEICHKKNIECQVSLETMMGCGVGACLGCAVEGVDHLAGENYLHVCKNGPVYEAKKVWA